MTGSRQRTREQVVTYARRLLAEHLVSYTAGNLSARVPDEPDLLAVTPASMPYDELEPDDIVIVGTDGVVVEGRRPPTSELRMHTLICHRRPEIGAVVHTHSRAVMTMANLGWTLPPILTGLIEAAGGDVRTSPYSRPESAQMADLTEEALRDRGATFLRYHGLLAVGATLHHAFRAASVVESACEVYLRLRQLGEVYELPAEQVAWIASYWRAQFPGDPAPRPGPPVPEALSSSWTSRLDPVWTLPGPCLGSGWTRGAYRPGRRVAARADAGKVRPVPRRRRAQPTPSARAPIDDRLAGVPDRR